MLKSLKKFFTLEYLVVGIILIISFVLRVFRVDQILNFNYDQGRDALVIWNLIYSPHKFFLIGPTTGLSGIFRGPFYYYLIAPFYWLGKGSPIYPSIFLAFLSVVALGIMYYLARRMGGIKTGIIALTLGTFSFEIIYAARWLSNPTPMLFLSMVLVLSLFLIQDGKKWAWVLLSFVLGCSFFHFGSSGELFYFPAVAIFAIWQFFLEKNGKRNIPNLKIIFYSMLAFLITFLPLFIFNLKHGDILWKNATGQVGGGKSFGIPAWRFISDRLSLIFVYLNSTIFHSPYEREALCLLALGVVFIYFLSRIIKNDRFKVIFILLICPVFGLLFYVGNYGNFYQYYLTGYYQIFILAVAYTLSYVFDSGILGKIAVVYFLYYFLMQNWSWINPYINTTSVSDPGVIMLSNQKQAIDWIYKDSGGRDFNVDEYVPPVITYSYNYLFEWLGKTKYQKFPVDKQISLLYTLYEEDPPNPDRLKVWLARQDGIGKVVREQTFGGITVQERTRVLYSR